MIGLLWYITAVWGTSDEGGGNLVLFHLQALSPRLWFSPHKSRGHVLVICVISGSRDVEGSSDLCLVIEISGAELQVPWNHVPCFSGGTEDDPWGPREPVRGGQAQTVLSDMLVPAQPGRWVQNRWPRWLMVLSAEPPTLRRFTLFSFLIAI